MNSQTIKETYDKYIIHTYNRYDVVYDQAEGATVWDTDGKEYIDLAAGIGVNCLGYGNSEWTWAVIKQLNKFQHTSNLFYHEPGAVLARKIVERSGLNKVFFCNSGAEANEVAFKIARKYGNTVADIHKNNIIYLNTSFHGRTITTVTATGSCGNQERFGPLTPGLIQIEANNIEQLKEAVAQYNPCALIMELVQGEGGVTALDQVFVDAAVTLCRNNDILFIDDEVQAGIGRTGRLFAYEYYGFLPDLVSFAKGIGAGLPIGGVLAGPKACDVMVPGDHGSTFGMNPVVCAGGAVVLDTLDEPFLAGVREKAYYLRSQLEAIDEIESTTGLGMMIGINLKTRDFQETAKDLIAAGAIVITAIDKIRLLPPLTITYEEIDKALEVFRKVLG